MAANSNFIQRGFKDESKLIEWEVPIPWVNEMRTLSKEAMAILRASCDHLDLLQLETEHDINTFEGAIVAYSNAAHDWAHKFVVDCVGFFGKKHPGVEIPPFAICKLGTFGRSEMSPYSYSKICFLCEPDHVKELEDGFSLYLMSVAATLWRTSSGETFNIYCDTEKVVWTSLELAENLGSYQGATLDIFSLFNYPDNKQMFLQRVYDKRDLFVTPIKKSVSKDGLDALLPHKDFSQFYTPRHWSPRGPTSYDVKSIAAFFQRGLAVLTAAKDYPKIDFKYQHGATSERLERYFTGRDARKLYCQVMAVRYAMHFDMKTKWDSARGKYFQRINDLRDQGLRDTLKEIDELLKALK